MSPRLVNWHRPVLLGLTVSLCASAAETQIASVLRTAEQAEAHSWVVAKFIGTPQARAAGPALLVLANHDPVQKNARHGKPLRLASQAFTRGLYCHAPSRILVRLPEPGATFSAVAGVDSNEQTSGARGSVEFVVKVGAEEKYRSGVVREGMAGQAVSVELSGAREFLLQVEETPDGISCDQADWADARVKLQDGRELWLADLPLQEGPDRAPFTAALPFSFVFDGKSSADWLAATGWERSSRALDAQRTEHTLTWAEPRSGLAARVVAVEYHDFPTIEWTVWFKNTGTKDTPLLSDILALDTEFGRPGGREFLLHHHKGTFVRVDDFEPLSTSLKPKEVLRFAPPAGRPLGQVFPYFNLEWQDEGVIAVVGWPGQWAAQFTRDDATGVRLTAGQELTHLRLRPGEEIRTPLVVLQFWRGDWLRSQNIWRRWMTAHNLPRPGGAEPRPLLTPCSSHQYGEMIQADEASQKLFIDRYLAEKLAPDYWWMDAGWYVHDGKGWPNTGTWEVDRARFPRGLRAITDHAHARGLKSIVWFEPERVAPDTFLYTNNPAWLLGRDGGQKLLNLGHPAAHAWLVEHISHLLDEQGIDLYRQDYNIDPLGFWRGADTEDRQGITENHYVTGYLSFWDELLRRHPGLVIDSCASGGHRNDLETMRRSLPFLRSDFIQDAVGNQCHTYGLSFWLPYHGTGTDQTGAYDLLSALACPHFIACWDLRDRTLDYDFLRQTMANWRQYADLYLGDYQPLTPYTTANDAWLAWQFHRPEQGRGLVQAFRRAGSFYESARFRLAGLESEARYRVTELDRPEATQAFSGRELMERGLLVTASRVPAAVGLIFRKEN